MASHFVISAQNQPQVLSILADDLTIDLKNRIVPLQKKTTYDQTPGVMIRSKRQELDPKQPIFCYIEDQIAMKSGVNFKFRLGSVSYVDALEGKGYFEATSYNRATHLRLSRSPQNLKLR